MERGLAITRPPARFRAARANGSWLLRGVWSVVCCPAARRATAAAGQCFQVAATGKAQQPGGFWLRGYRVRRA
ncbi:MAG: hypothetical protein ACYCZT_01880 [Thiobacillus sp.]